MPKTKKATSSKAGALEPLMLPASDSGMRLLDALSSILDPVISECHANRMLMAQQQKAMLHQCIQLNAQEKLIKSLYFELTGRPA